MLVVGVRDSWMAALAAEAGADHVLVEASDESGVLGMRALLARLGLVLRRGRLPVAVELPPLLAYTGREAVLAALDRLRDAGAATVVLPLAPEGLEALHYATEAGLPATVLARLGRHLGDVSRLRRELVLLEDAVAAGAPFLLATGVPRPLREHLERTLPVPLLAHPGSGGHRFVPASALLGEEDGALRARLLRHLRRLARGPRPELPTPPGFPDPFPSDEPPP